MNIHNQQAIRLSCLLALGLSGSAYAVQVAGEALEVYGNVYPEYRVTTFGAASTGPLSTLTAGNVVPGVGTGVGTAVSASQVDWLNSYIGFKGQKSFDAVRAGFDFQGLVMPDNNKPTSDAFGSARDAFVFIAHQGLGTLQMGQMDTIYKEFGERVHLLGTTSGNFTNTRNVMTAPSFKKGAGGTSSNNTGVLSFNTRINGQLRWISPNWSGVEVGVSLRSDPNRTNTQNQSLTSVGVRWSNATYYAAVTQETHNDYHGVSGTSVAGIYNGAGVASKDTASKLSLGYKAEKFRIGADLSRLEYTEAAVAVNKFSRYSNTNWQVTAEYRVTSQVTVGGNYGVNGAGSCDLSAGSTASCSTDGLGGTMQSLGARYDYDKNIGFFALLGRFSANSGAVLGGSEIGGDVTNAAVGLQVRF